MASEFNRTLRSLKDDSSRSVLTALGVGCALLVAWTAWLFAAEIPVSVVSQSARVEVDRVAHPIETPLAGRVSRIAVDLGAEVQAGDELLVLDSTEQRLELEQARTELEGRQTELAKLRSQRDTQAQALVIEQESNGVVAEEARARLREAQAAALIAADTRSRVKTLAKDGLVADEKLQNARFTYRKYAAAADAVRRSLRSIRATEQLSLKNHEAAVQALDREIAALAGEVAMLEAKLVQLEHDIDRRVIRSPADGVIIERDAVTTGVFVDQGERLGVLLPTGTLRIVAELAPSDALGRVEAGQSARLKLDGFAWEEHGDIDAVVDRVSGEARNGRVRVELSVLVGGSDIVLQHGLPGSVEIELEQTSPADLVLRAVGKQLGKPADVGAAHEGGQRE